MIMNTLPIDQNRITLITAGESYTAKDQAGNQVLNKEGKPLWFIPTLLTAPNSRPEMVRVKIASSQPPKVNPGVPIKFIGLQVIIWELNGKHGISYKAEAIESSRP
jgi:hypothetical protein